MSEQGLARQVLVVDDEPEVEVMFRQRMRREIRAGSYELFFAGSGQEALGVLRQNPGIRLVLTDLNMAGMGGWSYLASWVNLGRRSNQLWFLRMATQSTWA